MLSDKKRISNGKWDAQNMRVLSCKIRKEKADRFRAICQENGTTSSAVLRAAIDDYMAAHGAEKEI